jgi:hypothetical protein
MTFAVTIVGLMTFAQSAHAREHHYRHGHRHHIVASRGMSAAQRSGWSADSVSVWGSAPTSGIFAFAAAGNPSLETRTAYRGRDRGRPEAWCGWEMRHLVGADPGPSFNLARNWAHWGRPGNCSCCRLAAPRRKNRGSGKRPMGRPIRQRRPCGSHAGAFNRRCDCPKVGLIINC